MGFEPIWGGRTIRNGSYVAQSIGSSLSVRESSSGLDMALYGMAEPPSPVEDGSGGGAPLVPEAAPGAGPNSGEPTARTSQRNRTSKTS